MPFWCPFLDPHLTTYQINVDLGTATLQLLPPRLQKGYNFSFDVQRLWTNEELARYNGTDNRPPVLLSILGYCLSTLSDVHVSQECLKHCVLSPRWIVIEATS